MSRNHLILVFNLILKSNYLWEKSLLLKCVVFFHYVRIQFTVSGVGMPLRKYKEFKTEHLIHNCHV